MKRKKRMKLSGTLTFDNGFFVFTLLPMLSFGYTECDSRGAFDITFEWLVFHINLSIL